MAVLENIAVSTDRPLSQIQRDLRSLLSLGLAATGMMLAILAAILGVIAHGFHWL